MPQEVSPEKSFVPATLPWLVATGTFILYLCTLNYWVSFGSLAHVARVSGWLAWQPDLTAPLFWLVTLPFRLLPASLIPVALNLFAALCAAATLALLARSVALLPHDRTEAQRLREKSPFALLSIPAAWLPPLLAVLVCGLQMTFWENATAASSEIFDLLLFAYVVRCLLEFRLEGRDHWLFRAALVYGAAIPNNWAMLAFLPLFLVALVWLKGLSFFNGRFLGRMSLLALAGLSLYLLLPLLHASAAQISFWDALKANLGGQKTFLARLVFSKFALFKAPRPLWVLALPSLIPVLLLSIRWPASFGDTSKLGQGLATFILNLTYGVFFALCAWVALGPERFGPRYVFPGIPMLTLYYLGALSIGYFTGYFLLVFGSKPAGRPRPTPAYAPLLNTVVLGAVVLLALLLPGLLLYRNLPQVHITNGPLLRQYAADLTRGLPAQNAIVLSDDVGRLFLAQSALTQAGRAKGPLFLPTDWLQYPAYLRFLNRTRPDAWQFVAPPARKELISGGDLARLLFAIARTNSIYYLHPSFGYYFEAFYPEPHGLLYQLLPYPPNSLLAPAPSKEVLDQNEQFWNSLDASTLMPLTAAFNASAGPKDPGLLLRLCRRLRLATESNATFYQLASFYSRALDYWGVELQRAKPPLLNQAAARFEQALALNPDNIAAQANLQCNRELRAGLVPSPKVAASIEEQFSKYRNLDDMLTANGPFDAPAFRYALGMRFAYPGSPYLSPEYHQAAQHFNRVAELAPNDTDSHLRLAEILVFSRLPDQALDIVADIHARAQSFDLNPTNRPWLLAVETAAHLTKGDIPGAEAAVHAALATNPDNLTLLSAASRTYMTYACYSNALITIGRQLKLSPDDPNALYGQGLASLQLKSYDRAIDSFTRVLQLDTNRTSELHSYALLYRAQAALGSDKLDDAEHDYETLLKDVPTAISIYKELADLSLRKHDTNGAVRNLNLYLAAVPTNNVAELSAVRERLKQLQPGAR